MQGTLGLGVLDAVGQRARDADAEQIVCEGHDPIIPCRHVLALVFAGAQVGVVTLSASRASGSMLGESDSAPVSITIVSTAVIAAAGVRVWRGCRRESGPG